MSQSNTDIREWFYGLRAGDMVVTGYDRLWKVQSRGPGRNEITLDGRRFRLRTDPKGAEVVSIGLRPNITARPISAADRARWAREARVHAARAWLYRNAGCLDPSDDFLAAIEREMKEKA